MRGTANGDGVSSRGDEYVCWYISNNQSEYVCLFVCLCKITFAESRISKTNLR